MKKIIIAIILIMTMVVYANMVTFETDCFYEMNISQENCAICNDVVTLYKDSSITYLCTTEVYDNYSYPDYELSSGNAYNYEFSIKKILCSKCRQKYEQRIDSHLQKEFNKIWNQIIEEEKETRKQNSEKQANFRKNKILENIKKLQEELTNLPISGEQ